LIFIIGLSGFFVLCQLLFVIGDVILFCVISSRSALSVPFRFDPFCPFNLFVCFFLFDEPKKKKEKSSRLNSNYVF